jgi:hypothetical protein
MACIVLEASLVDQLSVRSLASVSALPDIGIKGISTLVVAQPIDCSETSSSSMRIDHGMLRQPTVHKVKHMVVRQCPWPARSCSGLVPTRIRRRRNTLG